MSSCWEAAVCITCWRQRAFERLFSEAIPTRDTLTHLSIFYEQQADGVLAAEVKYVNVVLNGNLWKSLHSGEGVGHKTRRNRKQYC